MLATPNKIKFTEVYEDLFDPKPKGSVRLLPVNSYIKSNGRGVFAQGCAAQAKKLYKDIDLNWGQELERQGRKRGNYGLYKTEAVGNFPAIIWKEPIIVACPTQWEFNKKADLSLIERSLIYILTMADFHSWNKIYLPRLGTGQGQRSYQYEIKPIFKDYLDERFIVCYL